MWQSWKKTQKTIEAILVQDVIDILANKHVLLWNASITRYVEHGLEEIGSVKVEQ